MRLDEIQKGQKDSNGYTKCWPGKHAEGTKKGKNGGRVRNCVPNESIEEGQLDEIIDPTTATAKALRYIGRKFATAFPWLAVGGLGASLAYAGLLAPMVTAVGGAANAIAALGTEAMVGSAVAGTYAAPSLIQSIKDLFAADENSIQAGIKRWVEKYVGDDNDVQEFLLTHARAAYEGKTGFRWRAKEWPVKLSKDQAEAYLEKNDKMWLDMEKQRIADANKKKEDEVEEAAPAAVRLGAGLGLGALAGFGGNIMGAVLGPLGSAIVGGYSGYHGAKMGMSAADWLWDKASSLLGGEDKAEEFAKVHLHTAANGDAYFIFNGKKFPVTLKPEQLQQATQAVKQVSEARNPRQQSAIAIAIKQAGKRPKAS